MNVLFSRKVRNVCLIVDDSNLKSEIEVRRLRCSEVVKYTTSNTDISSIYAYILL